MQLSTIATAVYECKKTKRHKTSQVTTMPHCNATAEEHVNEITLLFFLFGCAQGKHILFCWKLGLTDAQEQKSQLPFSLNIC